MYFVYNYFIKGVKAFEIKRKEKKDEFKSFAISSDNLADNFLSSRFI